MFSFSADGTLKRRHHRNPEGRGQSHQRLNSNDSWMNGPKFAKMVFSFRKSESVEHASMSATVTPSVFVTDNNTNVVAHKGSTTTLHCQVVKDSQYGVVSSNFKWNYIFNFQLCKCKWNNIAFNLRVWNNFCIILLIVIICCFTEFSIKMQHYFGGEVIL